MSSSVVSDPWSPDTTDMSGALFDPTGAAEREYLAGVLRGHDEARRLEENRRGRDVCWLEPPEETEPLVTVRIATHNRGPLVAERAIASARAQTYERVEILVVGDACDETTEAAVRAVDDPRVRFLNTGRRGVYPPGRRHRWMVAGAHPMNVALSVARGAWLAPCDDDDELTPDHVEVLLSHAKENRLEMVWSKARCEIKPGRWVEIGSHPLEPSRISHGSVLYSLGLRHFLHNSGAWRLDAPGDWNLWDRMRNAGARMGFLDRVTYHHYLEELQRGEAQ